MDNNHQHNRKDTKKTTFRDYYRSLEGRRTVAPKKQFIEEMAALCLVSTKTIRCYLAGSYRPDALRRRLISERLGIPEEELFPP